MFRDLPNNWKKKKIGELCDVSRGSSPRPIRDQRYFEGGSIPWVKIADATKSGKFLYETKQYVNEYGASFSRLLPPGTILVAASGTLGYTQILGVEACAHDGWLILQNLRGLDRDFAYYTLQWMEQHFYNAAYGAAIQNINTIILKDTEIPYPPLPTQRKIAAILSAYDDLIENNTRRIQILEEMAQTIYREWFVHFRFPGHENVPMVDSGTELGEIPEGWEVKLLVEVCDLVIGQSPKSEFYNESGDGLPFHQGVSNFGRRFPTHKIYCTVTNRIALPGDILFSVRAPVGRLNIADRKLVIGRGLHAIRDKRGHRYFLYQQLKDRFYEEDMMGGGTIFKSVTKSDMLELPLIQPTGMILSEFERNLKPIAVLIENLTKSNIILYSSREILLPRLISGQVDLSELEIEDRP